MRAIYINLDPYLQAVADWLDAGKPGDAPTFNPLPLAVTIPLGESAAFFMQTGTFASGAAQIQPWGDSDMGWVVGPLGSISDDSAPGEGTGGEASGIAFSAILQSQKTYWGHVGNLDSFDARVLISDSDGEDLLTLAFTVLVRREQASGPVDLVDFTPPASGTPSAANIKSALVAAGTGALAGVSLAGTVLNENDSIVTDMGGDNLYPFAVGPGDTIMTVIGYVTQS